MKKIILAMLCVSVVAAASCKRDDAEPKTADKLLGAWRLQKAVDEYYQPVNTLVDKEVTMGTAGDSVVFKNDNTVYSYSPVDGNYATTYEILNETTIEIEDELYEIKKLTNSELYLYQDHTEAATNTRYVQHLYFVR
jgi:hypothetical protein